MVTWNGATTMDYSKHSPYNSRIATDIAYGSYLSILSYEHLAGAFGENWAPAINAAIADCPNGGTIDFRQNDGIAGYNITEGIVNTKNSIRFLGRPRDGYAMAIHCNTPGVTMLTLKSSGIVLEDIAFAGDSSLTNGEGATVKGIDIYGDTDGNCDVNLRGVTFQGLAVAVRTRGRNVIFDGAQALFSNCLVGITVDGKDATYHTGPNADQNRGITIHNPRFHNIGFETTDACIKILPAAKMLHCQIESPYHDSMGKGKFIEAVGTVVNPIKAITVNNPKHTEVFSDLYDLTYVTNTLITNVHINGVAGVGGSTGRAFVLNNCDTIKVNNVLGIQLGGAGIYARNCIRMEFKSIRFRAIGGHGFDIDSTNSYVSVDDITVETATGWGWLGSPTNLRREGYDFISCSLGAISSTTFNADQIIVPATAFREITGTPNMIGVVGVGYPMAWQFDKDVVEQITSAITVLPNNWNTFDIYVVWAATEGSAGSVVWDVNYSFIAAGQLTSSGNVANPGTAVASPGIAGQATYYKIASNKARVGNNMVLRVDRNATSGSDTYPADAALIGIVLVRAT